MVSDSSLSRAIECVLKGGVLIYPTETVYGIGGNAALEQVSEKVRQIKGREGDKPMLVLTDTWERAARWIGHVSVPLNRLMNYEPSLPVTILFEPGPAAPEFLIGPSGAIAIRRTSNEFCLRLIRETGCLLLSTSANLSGMAPVSTSDLLEKQLCDQVDLVVSDSERLTGTPSTVISLNDHELIVLREGAVSTDTLKSILDSN